VGEIPRRPLRQRLTFRLGLGLCLGAAAILVAVLALQLGLQREQMTELVRGSAERTVETIQRSMHDTMLRKGDKNVQAVVDSIGGQRDIERIRIFDRDGRVTASSDPEEIERLVDLDAEQCIVCHDTSPPRESVDPRYRVREFTRNGNRLLAVTSPFRNTRECQACHEHPPERKVLGVLDVQLSLAPVEASLRASERQLGIGLTAAVVCVALLSAALVWWMVIRPVRALATATARVTQGDLTARVEVSSGDEVGALAASWNKMASELDRSRGELAGWSRTLEERVTEKTAELEAAHKGMLVVEKMASLGKLAAVVAHEINNPLAGIGTYAKLLRRRLGEDPQYDRALEMIEEESKRCGRIVRNLLLFSRDQQACLADVDLSDIVDRVIMLVRHRAELGDVDIAADLPPDLPPLRADRGQLQQLLLVLCLNAIEAMPDGGTLSVGARVAADGAVRIEVSDTGSGIPEEQLAHIFEPFFTTKEQGQGVGLGLAVAYGIVERHHGRIGVASTPGEGTTFTLHMPAMQMAKGTS
jgi:two-component system NtrC family sensor kinase